MADIPVADTSSHCAEMQQDRVDTRQPDANSVHDCKQGCDGSCCDDSCNACTQGTSAISGTMAVIPDIAGTPHNKIIPVNFYKRTIIPLLQPPASL